MNGDLTPMKGDPLLLSIGERAREWSSYVDTDMSDLSDILIKNEPFKDRPEFYQKLLEKYWRYHNHVTIDVRPPSWVGTWVLEINRPISIDQILVCTTLLYPIFAKMKVRINETAWGNQADGLDQLTVVRLVLRANKFCLFAIDGMDLTLVEAINFVADKFGVIFSQNVLENLSTNTRYRARPLRYPILAHIPKDRLYESLTRPETHFEQLSEWIEELPCAVNTPQIFRPSLLNLALREITDWALAAPLADQDFQIDQENRILQ